MNPLEIAGIVVGAWALIAAPLALAVARRLRGAAEDETHEPEQDGKAPLAVVRPLPFAH